MSVELIKKFTVKFFLRTMLLLCLINISIYETEARSVWKFIKDLGHCFACNCFVDDQYRNFTPAPETLNPDDSRTILKTNIWKGYNRRYSRDESISYWPNTTCPPYRRYKDIGGCLFQFTAMNWVLSFVPYDVWCIEDSKRRVPKKSYVTVRKQSCNTAFCFGNKAEIDGLSGECINWPMSFGAPVIRFCARLAYSTRYPKLTDFGRIKQVDGKTEYFYLEDHGYQYHFIDSNGFPAFDKGYQVKNDEGEVTDILYLPKICVYNDPSMYTLLSWAPMLPLLAFTYFPSFFPWMFLYWTYTGQFFQGVFESISSGASVTEDIFSVTASLMDRYDFRSTKQPNHAFGSIERNQKIMKENNYDKLMTSGEGISGMGAIMVLVDIIGNLSNVIGGGRSVNFQVFEKQHFNGTKQYSYKNFYEKDLYGNTNMTFAPFISPTSEQEKDINQRISTFCPTFELANNGAHIFLVLASFVTVGAIGCTGTIIGESIKENGSVVGRLMFQSLKNFLGDQTFYAECLEFRKNRRNFFEKAVTEKKAKEVSQANTSISYSETDVDEGLYKEWVKMDILCRHESIGCVEVRTGPYPPTYCDVVKPLPSIKLEKICSHNIFFDPARNKYVMDYEKSTYDNLCVQSNVRNNYIHNSARVIFTNLINVCKPSDNGSAEIGDCVELVRGNMSLKNLYSSTKGLINQCDNSLSNAPCFVIKSDSKKKFSGKYPMIFAANFNQDESKVTGTAFPMDINDECDSSDLITGPCVRFQGMNIAEFKDLTINLANNSGSQIIAKEGKFTIDSSISTPSYFSSKDKIDIKFVVEAKNNTHGTDNVIYATYASGGFSEIPTDSIPRAPPPLLRFLSCEKTGVCQSTPTNSDPFGVVQIGYNNITLNNAEDNKILSLINDEALISQLAKDLYYKVVKPRSLSPSVAADSSENDYADILGTEVETIVTNGQFTLPPFTDPFHTIKSKPSENIDDSSSEDQDAANIMQDSNSNLLSSNSSDNLTIVGNYIHKNDSSDNPIYLTPSTSTFKNIDQAENSLLYIGGLEYLGGNYNRGGEFLCAGPVENNQTCPQLVEELDANGVPRMVQSYSNCILSKLAYSDIINCCQYLHGMDDCNTTQATDNPENRKDTLSSIRKCSYLERLSALKKLPSSSSADDSTKNYLDELIIPSCKITNRLTLKYNSDPDRVIVTTASCKNGNKPDEECSLVLDEDLMPINANICAVSLKPEDRVIPNNDSVISFGTSLNEFYNGKLIEDPTNYCYNKDLSSSSIVGYDRNKCSMRPKSFFEKGDCITIPSLAKCSPISGASEEYGFALFPSKIPDSYNKVLQKNGDNIPQKNSDGYIDIELPIGSDLIEGSCASGYSNFLNPKTRCVGKVDGNIGSEIIGEYSTQVINKCSRDCDAISQISEESGWATWPSGSLNEVVNGTCPEGYEGNPTRICRKLDDGNIYGPVINPCKRKHEIFHEFYVLPSINNQNKLLNQVEFFGYLENSYPTSTMRYMKITEESSETIDSQNKHLYKISFSDDYEYGGNIIGVMRAYLKINLGPKIPKNIGLSYNFIPMPFVNSAKYPNNSVTRYFNDMVISKINSYSDVIAYSNTSMSRDLMEKLTAITRDNHILATNNHRLLRYIGYVRNNFIPYLGSHFSEIRNFGPVRFFSPSGMRYDENLIFRRGVSNEYSNNFEKLTDIFGAPSVKALRDEYSEKVNLTPHVIIDNQGNYCLHLMISLLYKRMLDRGEDGGMRAKNYQSFDFDIEYE